MLSKALKISSCGLKYLSRYLIGSLSLAVVAGGSLSLVYCYGRARGCALAEVKRHKKAPFLQHLTALASVEPC